MERISDMVQIAISQEERRALFKEFEAVFCRVDKDTQGLCNYSSEIIRRDYPLVYELFNLVCRK